MQFMDDIDRIWSQCNCGHPHQLIRMPYHLEYGALAEAAAFAGANGHASVCLAADSNTFQAAGGKLRQLLEDSGIRVDVCMFQPDERGDVLADSRSVLRLLLHISEETSLLLAVGAGTIHDIVRFVSLKTGKPFVSVPTAASVDGFISRGAPLIVDGVKRTIPAVAPIAVFADLDVLSSAPRALMAAGFGDMLGKWTSLADWRVSRDLGKEPFCPAAYSLTEQAMRSCVEHVDDIAEARPEGLRVLMSALIQSGAAMLSIGHSRPASGGEHHVSHVWEMQCIARQLPQLLHGAKVGVATVMIAGLYRRLAREVSLDAFRVYEALPEPEQIAGWLRRIGAPVSPEELGIDKERTVAALKEGPGLRDRMTGLKYVLEHHPEWLSE